MVSIFFTNPRETEIFVHLKQTLLLGSEQTGGSNRQKGLEMFVKYNKRGGWNIRGEGRKKVNGVPLRLD